MHEFGSGWPIMIMFSRVFCFYVSHLFSSHITQISIQINAAKFTYSKERITIYINFSLCEAITSAIVMKKRGVDH